MKPSRPAVLIANRGEIAIRITRTCRMLGFPVIAIYSDADRFAEHVQMADRAFGIGGTTPKENYLNIEKIIHIAKISEAQLIHPGYGFLSERPHFVEACERVGLTFVGPAAESMRLMGDKIQARIVVDRLKVPRVPGSLGVVSSAAQAATIAQEVGFPVLLKAAAGGGGKGMRRVNHLSEIPSAFEGATREAQSAFGEGSLYMEKLILKPHHVEIQVFGDGKGKAIHLGERECSIQRRYQKIWEETPAPILSCFPKTREQMFEAAVRIAEDVKYAGAGTLEFIVDEMGSFYFLEMNTRLQVEHPITEWVTGVDLVAWQLLLAVHEFQLPSGSTPVEPRGSAVEVRLCAEDPQTFLPAPGPLGMIRLPSGPFVRVDTAFHHSGEVSAYYDPLIAKISVWAWTRSEAIERLRVALDETCVQPTQKAGKKVGSLRTNLSFLQRLVRHEAVKNGDTSTDLIEKYVELTLPPDSSPSLEAALATAIFQLVQEGKSSTSTLFESSLLPWSIVARKEGIHE